MTKFDKRSFWFVVLLMFVGVESEPGLAQTSHWAVYGPVGGSVYRLAVDP